LFNEIFKGDAAGEGVQAPPGGDMADDQDPLPVPAQWQVGEEAADAADGLLPASPAGLQARIVQRLLALNTAIWHNWQIGAPVKRSLIAYDH
jgi:hypothetical protein